MKTNLRSFHLTVLLSLAVTVIDFSVLMAQQAGPLPYSLGEIQREGIGSIDSYSVSVTGPLDSTGQEIRFVARRNQFDTDTGLPGGEFTRVATVKSGRSSTLRETAQAIAGAFDQFLARTDMTENALLVKLGDIRQGGELYIVAESADTLRFDYVNTSGAEIVRFDRDEVEEFAAVLNDEPALIGGR